MFNGKFSNVQWNSYEFHFIWIYKLSFVHSKKVHLNTLIIIYWNWGFFKLHLYRVVLATCLTTCSDKIVLLSVKTVSSLCAFQPGALVLPSYESQIIVSFLCIVKLCLNNKIPASPQFIKNIHISIKAKKKFSIDVKV